jgi:Tol biopolymer transport system component
MLMVLVATAMAVLLAGCGSSQREDQGSSQGSEQEEGNSQQISEAMMSEQTYELTTNETVVGSSQQTPEPTTNKRLVGRCADSDSTGGQQEQASGGEVSNGKIAFTRNSDIHVIDGEGDHETRLTYTAQVSEDHPVWSPDGQKIAFTANKSGEQESALYVMNADGTNKIQLAADVLWFPSWSSDGQKIAFTTSVEYEYVDDELSVINVDGTHKVSLSTAAPFSGNPNDETRFGSPVWSPTGNKIAFASRTVAKAAASVSPEPASATAEGLTGIYLINVDGKGLCKLISTTEALSGLVWSPDGEQLAFSHRDTIYVINADGSGRKQLAEGYSAAWSPDGQKIAFVNDSYELHVMNPDGSGMRRLAKTTVMIPSLTLPAWSPDGEKIAFPCPADQGAEAIYHSDICVINPDGTEWKRIALKGDTYSLSWGSE